MAAPSEEEIVQAMIDISTPHDTDEKKQMRNQLSLETGQLILQAYVMGQKHGATHVLNALTLEEQTA